MPMDKLTDHYLYERDGRYNPKMLEILKAAREEADKCKAMTPDEFMEWLEAE